MPRLPASSLLGISIIAFLGLYLGGWWLFHELGYSVAQSMYDGQEIGKKIAQDGRSPKDCLKILTFFPSYPTRADFIGGCILDYAEIAKDPIACTTILPNPYAWPCFGVVENQLFKGKPCSYNQPGDSLYCNRYYSEGEIEIEHPQIDDCSQYQRKDLREWCAYERTIRLQNIYDCAQITHETMRDQCEYDYALKLRDTSLCTSVKDEKRQAYCRIRVEASAKYKPL